MITLLLASLAVAAPYLSLEARVQPAETGNQIGPRLAAGSLLAEGHLDLHAAFGVLGPQAATDQPWRASFAANLRVLPFAARPGRIGPYVGVGYEGLGQESRVPFIAGLLGRAEVHGIDLGVAVTPWDEGQRVAGLHVSYRAFLP